MTLSDPPFVEGTVLEGAYEVGEHLATTPAGHLHAVLNTSEARPRRQVLLARPADSEPDLRLAGRPPAPGSAIPALVASFDTGDRNVLVLDVPASVLVSDQRPANDEELLSTLVAAAGIIEELRLRDASPTPVRAAHLACTNDGLLYVGPVVVREESAAEVLVLARLARELAGSQSLWSAELQDMLSRRNAGNLLSASRGMRLNAPLHLTCGWASETGPHRREDEDALLRLRWSVMSEGVPESAELLALADGMGGHRNGAVAARLALHTLAGALLSDRADETLHGSDDSWLSNDGVAALLRRAVQLASDAVAAMAEPNEELPPGCTMALAWRLGRRLFVVGAGDSRVGLVRHGSLTWLTRDDRGGPGDGHYLTQCLGQRQPLHLPVVERLLQPGDRVLLCCDGVWEVLAEEALLTELSGGRVPVAVAEALVTRAIAAGSTDNVTAAVAVVQEGAGD